MSHPVRPRGREAGFTLVEVLVAFFIAALTLAIALRVLGEGAALARRGPAAALRMEEAASVLDMLAADPALRPGERDGIFADGSPWHAHVTDVTARAAAAGGGGRLLRLDLNAGRGDGAPLLVTLAAVAGSPR